MVQVVLMEVAAQVAPTGQAEAVERRVHMEAAEQTEVAELMEAVVLVAKMALAVLTEAVVQVAPMGLAEAVERRVHTEVAVPMEVAVLMEVAELAE
jgi:hypothetical protein